MKDIQEIKGETKVKNETASLKCILSEKIINNSHDGMMVEISSLLFL